MAVRSDILNFQYTVKALYKERKEDLVPRGDAMNTDQKNRYHIFHRRSQILKEILFARFYIKWRKIVLPK